MPKIWTEYKKSTKEYKEYTNMGNIESITLFIAGIIEIFLQGNKWDNTSF